MEPKRLLWCVVFVYSARWLVPAQVQHKVITKPSQSLSGSVSHISTQINDTFNSEARFTNAKISLTSPAKYSEVESLSELLMSVIRRELNGCDLILTYNPADLYSAVVSNLLMMMPSLKQVVLVKKIDDIVDVVWDSSVCGSYLFLMTHPNTLINFVNTHLNRWNYKARYVMVLRSLEDFKVVASSKKGKKTEHLVGIVKSVVDGEWRVYMNQLYSGEQVKFVTTWRQHRFTTNQHLFPDKLADLHGAKLKVSTFELAPSIMYYRSKNGTLLFRYGEDIALTETLARVLNFTALFAEPTDGKLWGNKVNGTWNGINGELGRGDVDLGMANFFISIKNLEVLDFSAPYKIEMTCFMARTEPLLPRWQSLAFPFQTWTWIAILVGLIFAGPTLSLLTAGSHTQLEKNTSLAYDWLYTFGQHFREPQSELPTQNSTRIYVLFLWLYTIIITIAYSTNLTAFLLVQKPPYSIQTIREVHDSSLEVAALGYIFNYSLASSKDPYLNGLTKVYRAYPSESVLFSRALEGKTIVLQNRGYLEFYQSAYLSHQGTPRLRILKECFAPYNIAMVMQKYSPLKSKVDLVIGWLQQSGLIDHYFRQSLRLAANNQESHDEGEAGDDSGSEGTDGSVIALSLDHMQGVFMIAALGWLVALHVFFVEKFIIS